MFDLEIKNLKSFSIYLQKLIEGRLWLKVIIALVLGVGVGLLMSPDFGWVPENISYSIGNWMALPGNLFLKLVQMIMIPLIFASIIRGIISNDLGALKKMGVGVGVYFVSTTFVSICIGVLVSSLFKPGELLNRTSFGNQAMEGANLGGATIPSIGDIPLTISELLPSNPLASMVSGEMLSIVIFTIIIGVAITSLNAKTREPIVTLLSAIQEISMIVIKWAMKLVPIAVFGLMVQLSSTVGLESVSSISFYALVVIIGLALLMVFYSLMLILLGKASLRSFYTAIKDVQLLAFSTTSSAAVMPLSLKTAEEKLEVDPAVGSLIIPIGATVNMDGTAIYQCITAMFIAQVYGMDMNFANIVFLMVTVVAASIGTPAIPGGGVIILATVLQSVGIPSEGIIIVIGTERILGMFRSTVNVTGDLVAAVIFNRWYGSKKNDKAILEPVLESNS